jgi:hypothetical protein
MRDEDSEIKELPITATKKCSAFTCYNDVSYEFSLSVYYVIIDNILMRICECLRLSNFLFYSWKTTLSTAFTHNSITYRTGKEHRRKEWKLTEQRIQQVTDFPLNPQRAVQQWLYIYIYIYIYIYTMTDASGCKCEIWVWVYVTSF